MGGMEQRQGETKERRSLVITVYSEAQDKRVTLSA